MAHDRDVNFRGTVRLTGEKKDASTFGGALKDRTSASAAAACNPTSEFPRRRGTWGRSEAFELTLYHQLQQNSYLHPHRALVLPTRCTAVGASRTPPQPQSARRRCAVPAPGRHCSIVDNPLGTLWYPRPMCALVPALKREANCDKRMPMQPGTVKEQSCMHASVNTVRSAPRLFHLC